MNYGYNLLMALLLFVVIIPITFSCILPWLSKMLENKSKYAVSYIISKPENFLSDDDAAIQKAVSDLDFSIDKITNGISKFIVVIFILIFSLFLMALFVIRFDKGEYVFSDVAAFFNGVTTPVLTFLTFSGMLIAIIMQHIQMKTTLIELKLSRAEMIKSNQSFKVQAENADLQKNNYLHEKFVNNFYSLFNSFNKIIDSHTESKELKDFFAKLSSLGNLAGLEHHMRHHRSLVSKVSAVNAQMLAYIRDQSRAGGGASEEDKTKSVISFAEAKRYAELISSYVSNEILIIFALDAIINKKYEYFDDLKNYGFVQQIDLKINCVAFGKLRELMESINESQLNEFLRYSGQQGLDWVFEFQSIHLYIDRDRSSFSRVLDVDSEHNFKSFLTKIWTEIVNRKYFGDEVHLISSFDKDFLFNEFNIDLDELYKLILKDYIGTFHYEKIKLEIENFRKIN